MPRVNSIKLIINEVEKCQKSGCYLSALITALTIPDICGKVLYPDLKSHDRYVKWFDKYIGNYEQSPLAKEEPKWAEMPYMTGEICFQLRCELLHEGSDDIGKKIDVDEFLLLFGKSCRLGSSEIVGEIGYNPDGTEYLKNKRVSFEVNVERLCNQLIWSAEAFLKKEISDESKIPTINLDEIPIVFRR